MPVLRLIVPLICLGCLVRPTLAQAPAPKTLKELDEKILELEKKLDDMSKRLAKLEAKTPLPPALGLIPPPLPKDAIRVEVTLDPRKLTIFSVASKDALHAVDTFFKAPFSKKIVGNRAEYVVEAGFLEELYDLRNVEFDHSSGTFKTVFFRDVGSWRFLK